MRSTTTKMAKSVVGTTLFISLTAGAVLFWTEQEPATPQTAAGSEAGYPIAREAGAKRPNASEEQRRSANSGDAGRQFTDLDERITALSAELARLKPAQGSQAQAEQEQEAQELSPEEQEAQAEAAIEAQELSVEEAIETEEVDPDWSPIAEMAWGELFQKEDIKDELKDLQLVNVECRTNLCRVELSPSDPTRGGAHFEQNFRKLLLFAPWDGPGFGKVDYPDGETPQAVFYIAREGQTLPEPLQL